jgi:hypothetical protein
MDMDAHIQTVDATPYGPQLAQKIADGLERSDYCPINGMGQRCDGFALDKSTGEIVHCVFDEGTVMMDMQRFKDKGQFAAWLAQQSDQSMLQYVYTQYAEQRSTVSRRHFQEHEKILAEVEALQAKFGLNGPSL